MAKRRWAELGPGERAGIVALATVQIGLLVAALVDLARRNPEEVKGPRWAWALASFVNFAGPITYFVAGRRTKHPVD